jgi:demethylmenaquinone methyltransferase / 2-methoxy-6-polyprenyl-1,4-benzoquinol methylase
MGNIYFEPGQQRARKVHELFERIARRYDLLNDLQSFGLHRHWKEQLVCLTRAHPGLTALDVCCGTGDIALALARSGAAVTGLDFSEEMLAVARTKAEIRRPKSESGNPGSEPVADACTNPGSKVHFIRGDAQKLPFPDQSFDIVTVGYGLRNLADFETGLREMQRVSKPGGRLLVLDFGKPDNALWRAIYFGYLRVFVPLLGLVFCGSASAYAYILESLKHYPAQRGVAAKMLEIGLVNVSILNLLGGVMSINLAEKAGGPPTASR